MSVKISTRVGVIFAGIAVMLLSCGGAGYYGAKKLADGLQYITTIAWDASDGAMEGIIHIQKQIIHLNHLANTTDEDEAKQIIAEIAEEETIADKALTLMAATGLIEKGLLNQLESARSSFANTRNESLSAYANYRSSPDDETSATMAEVNKRLLSNSSTLLALLTKLEATGTSKVTEFSDKTATIQAEAYSAIFISATMGILLTLIAYIVIIKSIVTPIRNMGKQFLALAEGDGDLTTTMSVIHDDEIGDVNRGFNLFIGKIKTSIQQVITSSGELGLATGRLTQISNDTTDNLSQQQQETEQVATAMNEMVATVQEVARNVSDAADAANAANREAANGKQIVVNSIKEINALAAEVRQAAEVMKRLEKDSDNIGSVLSVIKEIADQTNLLALNAAIEAARAGEQGRGFAVVADEVRTLASRTQKSTEEIQKMIERLQSGTHEAVSVMERGQKRAQSSVDQANNAGTALESITAAVVTISQMTTQIASAAEEQNAVAEEVNNSIINISNMSQQSSTSAGEITSSTQQLGLLAKQLNNVVIQFRV